VVQAGKYGQNLGELVITVDGGKLTVESYQLHPIDDTMPATGPLPTRSTGTRRLSPGLYSRPAVTALISR
jgi:2',3'-cyclic-nucleotide 2'-phosphodiesterase (5'-nucleotidase family)